MSDVEKMRIDKWLWVARFFKTRALASKAVDGGHIHVNGRRVKASRPVHAGEQLSITRSQTLFTVLIKGLSEKRGPAKEAQSLYNETAESIQRRKLLAVQRKLFSDSMPGSRGKPDKHQRRQIRKAKGKVQ